MKCYPRIQCTSEAACEAENSDSLRAAVPVNACSILNQIKILLDSALVQAGSVPDKRRVIKFIPRKLCNSRSNFSFPRPSRRERETKIPGKSLLIWLERTILFCLLLLLDSGEMFLKESLRRLARAMFRSDRWILKILDLERINSNRERST